MARLEDLNIFLDRVRRRPNDKRIPLPIPKSAPERLRCDTKSAENRWLLAGSGRDDDVPKAALRGSHGEIEGIAVPGRGVHK